MSSRGKRRPSKRLSLSPSSGVGEPESAAVDVNVNHSPRGSPSTTAAAGGDGGLLSPSPLPAVVNGGRLDRARALFSADAHYFFLACGNNIKVYSVATGTQVRVLRGHDDLVTSLAIHADQPKQIFSSSRDGTIRLWNFADVSTVSQCQVGAPILSMSYHPFLQALFVSTECVRKKKAGQAGTTTEYYSRVLCYTIVKESAVFMFETPSPLTTLTVSPTGDFVVGVMKKIVVVYSVDSELLEFVNHTRLITALAIHPGEECVAIGDEGGHIRLLNCLDDEAEIDYPSPEQWHQRAVGALLFDSVGTHLISGGREATLVFWELATGKKDYLPRLGTKPLTALSASLNEDYYAVTSEDNVVRIVNPKGKSVVATVRGLSHAGPYAKVATSKQYPSAIVLPGANGSIQFYDAYNDTSLAVLAVVDRDNSHLNFKKSDRKKLPKGVTLKPYVRDFQFTGDGHWLLTTSKQKRVNDCPLEMVKFWEWAENENSYVLNSVMEHPHDVELASLAVHPTRPIALTTARDGSFGLWTVKRTDPSANELARAEDKLPSEVWSCYAKGKTATEITVGVKNDASVRGSSAFAMDGSLFAICYQNVVSLWDPLTVQLLTTFAYPPPSEQLVGVKFFGGADSRCLLAYSKTHLYMWNLLNYSLMWSLKIHVSTVVVNTATSHILVLSKSMTQATGPRTTLFLFSPSTPTPLYYWNLSHYHSVKTVTFLPSPTGANNTLPNLALVSHSNTITIFSLNGSTGTLQGEDSADALINSSLLDVESTLFSSLYSQQATDLALTATNLLQKEITDTSDKTVLQRAISDIFAGSSHILPPPSTLFNPFLDRLLKKDQPEEDDLMDVQSIVHELASKSVPPVPVGEVTVDSLTATLRHELTTISTLLPSSPPDVSELTGFLSSLSLESPSAPVAVAKRTPSKKSAKRGRSSSSTSTATSLPASATKATPSKKLRRRSSRLTSESPTATKTKDGPTPRKRKRNPS